MITAGSGLGAFAAVAQQKEYGAAFVTPTRTLYFKTFKPTFDPHFVQGGPYLAGGRIADIGSAHVKMYTDAKATLTGDVMTIGQALLLASAFGSAGKLTQSGTTTAYELGGAGGIKLEAPESHNATKESTFLDMQVGVPYTNAEVVAYSYHSGVVTKAEFVFDRIGLCAYSYDIDYQYLENTTALITPAYTTNGVPFAMNEGSSEFKIGTPGGAVALAGVRKITVTLEHKMATDRIYLGEEHKAMPISNGLVDIGVAVELDYTEAAKNVFKAFLNNEALEIIAIATGAEIGSSGKKNLFEFKMPNVFLASGVEPPIEGPDLIKNNASAKATINATNEAVVSAKLITADTTF